MKQNVNTSCSLLKVEDTTLKKLKTKPDVLIRRIKSKLKSKSLTEVISTGSKHKYKTTISKTPQKLKLKQNKIVDRTGFSCTNTKIHMEREMENTRQNEKDTRLIRRENAKRYK